MNSSPIIVALDFPSKKLALELVERLEPSRCRLKVGKEIFTREGPQLVEELQKRGFDVFLDLKYHDIPNTVAGACRAAAELGVWMVNVHALGGQKMMEAAAEALSSYDQRPQLIAVTILTSMGAEDLLKIGLPENPEANVLNLAELTENSGLDGVVCSPKEVTALRRVRGADFKLITPGIRPEWAAKGDQNRITTPAQAIEMGSNYLVIGRPITGAEDPMEALAKIEQEISV
ncbi:MAG TPA: orotidine-5'-phosphate decarboxylase [Ectothiorhodospiraceae bacterium]|nr:orotidine-5'-phosphate decarboxylase [Ectothiorhodospiraceae bacterium]